jgi:outer membrane biosynthesis protein TonB
MAVSVSKAKAMPSWPAAMAASLGLHLAALLFAISEVPRRPSDPAIEVEVLPVPVEVPQALPWPEPDKTAHVAQGAGVEKRRGPATPRSARRPQRPATNVVSPTETAPAELAPVPEAVAPASADSVVVAKTEAAGPPAIPEGTSGSPSPGGTGLRIGSAKTVAPAVGDGLLAINPNDGRYQPTIPQPLRKPGASFLSRLKFCVTADGSVDKVTVVTSSEPAINDAILEKARLYRFNPYFDQGRPIPFCFYRQWYFKIQE